MALKSLTSCGLAAAPLILLALGCSSREVTRARVPKAAGASPPALGMKTDTVDVPLPRGWTETRPGGMRVAALVPPVSGVGISVTALPGPAGGERANVNCWRGQIGLKPVDDAGLARQRTAVKAPAGTHMVLAVLVAMVVLCTLAQVNLGTFGTLEVNMRSWLVWWQPTDCLALPVFPRGALAGLALLANLVTVMVQRFTLSAKKADLWIVHAGLILLVPGESVTGALQVEHSLASEEGQTVNYVERARHHELAVIDTTDPNTDEVYGIPEARLAQGGEVALPGTPITLRLKAFHRKAELSALAPGGKPSGATAGIGRSVQITPQPPVASDTHLNLAAVLVEPVAADHTR